MVEQHKPHLKQVNSSAVNHEVRYAPHADLLLPIDGSGERFYP